MKASEHKGAIIIGFGVVFVIVCRERHNDTAARKTNLQFVCKLKNLQLFAEYAQSTFDERRFKADPLTKTQQQKALALSVFN